MEKIKKSDHFYLIDGSGYIFRAYYALPPLTRKSDGLPVGAVSGFCNMLFKLLEDSKSDDNLEKPYLVHHDRYSLDATDIAHYAAWLIENDRELPPATPLYLAPAKINQPKKSQ